MVTAGRIELYARHRTQRSRLFLALRYLMGAEVFCIGSDDMEEKADGVKSGSCSIPTWGEEGRGDGEFGDKHLLLPCRSRPHRQDFPILSYRVVVPYCPAPAPLYFRGGPFCCLRRPLAVEHKARLGRIRSKAVQRRRISRYFIC